MRKLTFIGACFLVISGMLNAGENRGCDRQCLIALMDQYLAALARHDPTAVPLAAGVKFVENTEKTAIGKGLWQTTSAGPGDFKIYVADPVAGQVGFMGVIQVRHQPAILAARLKVVDGAITEIDHLIRQNAREPISRNFIKPRAALVQSLKPSERVSREQMVKAASSYYEAILGRNGKIAPFALECQRRENGVITANHAGQTPEEAEKDDFSAFRKMTCSDQISSGVWSNITGINHRRIIAVDEEMGLVFAYSMLAHDGNPKVMKITGVPGITERPNSYGAFDTVAAHVFKLRNGKIYEIEAIGYMGKHGIRNGWE